jgi:hypothetical protein
MNKWMKWYEGMKGQEKYVRFSALYFRCTNDTLFNHDELINAKVQRFAGKIK